MLIGSGLGCVQFSTPITVARGMGYLDWLKESGPSCVSLGSTSTTQTMGLGMGRRFPGGNLACTNLNDHRCWAAHNKDFTVTLQKRVQVNLHHIRFCSLGTMRLSGRAEMVLQHLLSRTSIPVG